MGHAVGGQVASGVDYEDNLSGSLPLVLGFVLALTFLVMSATFRSVVIGLTAIVINLLSTLAPRQTPWPSEPSGAGKRLSPGGG